MTKSTLYAIILIESEVIQMAKKQKQVDRRAFKKEGEELRAYLQFQRKGGKHKDNKKYKTQIIDSNDATFI